MRLKSATTSMLEKILCAVTWLPHAYQKRAIKWLLEHACAGLFLDPGLGKTSIVLAALKILKKKGVLRGALIVAPLRVCHLVWPEEIAKWKDFSELTITVLHGDKKQERLQQDVDIYMINPEGLPWLLGPPPMGKRKPAKDAPKEVHDSWQRAYLRHQKEIARAAPNVKRIFTAVDILVVDESTKFKHASAKRFKILKQYLAKFSRRWILTGTPAPNGYMDLFGQAYIMDTGRSLGSFITHYRNDYFLSVGFGGFTYVLKPQADKLIQARLRPAVLSLRAEDHLDMPKFITNIVKVALPEDAMTIYWEMEQELFTMIDQDEIEAVNSASASMKCRQIANGGIYVDRRKGDSYYQVHGEKIEALKDLIEQLSGQPLLVAYEFQHDLARLREALGQDVPVMGKGSSADDKKLKDAWNRGEIPVMLGQPASMAYGLNLQEGGGHIAFFSLIWDFELFDQFIRRILRQGQKRKSVFLHLISAKGTVDEVIVKTLAQKDKTQKGLLSALNAYRRSKK